MRRGNEGRGQKGREEWNGSGRGKEKGGNIHPTT